MTELYAVILVHSINHAIRVEKVLGRGGLVCKLIPVPRHLSSDCGACVRIRRVDQEAAQHILQAEKVEISAIYDL
jgi:hypothetical protein